MKNQISKGFLNKSSMESKQNYFRYNKYFLGLLFLLGFYNPISAQETNNISVGVDYSLETINLKKTSVAEQFSYNGISDSIYQWSSDEIADFNQGDFIITKNNVSFRIFSGLTGNDSSKFRFGFGVHLGLSSLQEQTSFKDEMYLLRKSRYLNLEGGASAYLQYGINDRWKTYARFKASLFKTDLNSVKDYDEYYNNIDDLTISYNNSIFTIYSYVNIMVDYSWKDFDFQLGPQLVFNYTESTYNQLINDNSNGDTMRNYASYYAQNDSYIRGSFGIQWNRYQYAKPYLQMSLGKDFQFIVGIQF